jgi:hypothetical protein
LPSCATQQRNCALPQRGADENGLATVNLASTLRFAKFENRKHIQMQKANLWRRQKKFNKTATSTQSHQPASSPTKGCLPDFILKIQTFMFRILVATRLHQWCNLGWLKDGAYTIFHRICTIAGPMESPQCKSYIISLHARSCFILTAC